LLNWPAIYTDRDFEVPAVKLFVVIAAKGLQFAKPEARHVAAMVFDVMDDGCGHGTAFSLAEFAQGMLP
jgi:hypothetical protein